MKRLVLILGWLVGLAIIVAVMYVGLVIGINRYMAFRFHARALAYAAQREAQTEAPTGNTPRPEPSAAPIATPNPAPINTSMANPFEPQLRRSIETLGRGPSPEDAQNKQYEDELAGKLPTLFVDPEGYGTEDNWLATNISREIGEMAFVALHPGATLPDLEVTATVNPDKPSVRVDIDGLGGGMITSNLAPAFAWDPAGYSVLARQLLGTTPGLPAAPAGPGTDVLANLLNLTGPTLAAEDVRLSTDLQLHPTSWQDHEAAALLLTALVLRDESSTYSEKRTKLNRVTAHLAIAAALRGNEAPAWPGLIADAALRTQAGRAVDALAHLDALTARNDVPAPAKTWIMALRVLAKQNWREAEVATAPPLLLKIVWFQALMTDLTPDLAVKHLKDVVAQPTPDPNLPSGRQPATPGILIPDWGRIARHSPFYDESDDAVKNSEYRMGLEFKELAEILQTEGAPPFDVDKLASIYSAPVPDTVSRDANAKTVVHVIGAPLFADTSRREVFCAVIGKSFDSSQDAAQVENLFAKFDRLLQGVPGWDMARIHLNVLSPDDYRKQVADWVAAKKTWPIWEVPCDFTDTLPGYGFVRRFYHRAVPFGTVFEPINRYTLINDMNPWVMPPYGTPELEKIKTLPINQALLEVGAYNARYNAKIEQLGPHGPKPFEQALLKLVPYEYSLAVDHVPEDKLMAAVPQFLDYNIDPITRIEDVDADHLGDADRIAVLRKHVAIEPAFGFRAAVVLRGKGLDDEAAGMERKAFATQEDSIGMADSVLPLVDYDLRHNLNDEALKVAQYAGNAGSQVGLATYAYALEKLGRLDEAEKAAQAIKDNYADDSWLIALQIRHRDRYGAIYDQALANAFPDGLVRTDLSHFSGSPADGELIKSDSDSLKASGLQVNDVVVALDGYRIGSDAQYRLVRALNIDSHMDFIVWRNGQYLEIKAAVPGRRMMDDIGDYHPR